jgi:hypothetical protein
MAKAQTQRRSGLLIFAYDTKLEQTDFIGLILGQLK